MKILPISNYNYCSNQINRNENLTTTFCANAPKALAIDASKLSERGKTVVNYLREGCPRTAEGEKNYKRIFGTGLKQIDLIHCDKAYKPIDDIIESCENNLEVIDRALGRYGLERYGNLPHGSAVTEGNYLETGYFSPLSGMHDNIIWFFNYNKEGSNKDLAHRFGEAAERYPFFFKPGGVIQDRMTEYRVTDEHFIEDKAFWVRLHGAQLAFQAGKNPVTEGKAV